MKRILITSLLILSVVVLLAQDKKDEAKKLAEEAANKVRFEHYEAGIKLYKKALKLDKQNPDYTYEMAYAYYSLGKNKKAFKLIDPFVKANVEYKDKHGFLSILYASLGKEYKTTPEEPSIVLPKTAKEYADEGIKLFETDKASARINFDQAIDLDPTNTDYYYYAAKLYAATEEKIWTLIYGEIFVNLERNTERTIEIKKLIYANFQLGVIIKPGGEITIDVSKDKAVYNLKKFDETKFNVNFAQSYSTTLELCAPKLVDGYKLSNLYFFEKDFVNYWFRKKELEFPCFLFDWQKSVFESGHLEAYIYWLYKDSLPTEYNEWNKYFSKQMDAFMTWFSANQMDITNFNRVNPIKY